jgi:hypothetical protein
MTTFGKPLWKAVNEKGNHLLWRAAEILNNTVIAPPNEDLVNAGSILLLSVDSRQFYDEIWERYTTAP